MAGLPELYLSAPAARLPETALTNNQVLDRVRDRFRGTDAEWKLVERLIRYVFRLCGSELRYMEERAPRPVADHAVAAAHDLLASYGLHPMDLDAVVYGSIAREYFEPATATEVSDKLGAHRALSYDVVAACAGALLAVQDLVARFAVDPDLKVGLVSTASITETHLSYDIQTPEQVDLLAAGLTIGNAATAMLVTREPLPRSGRIRAMFSQGMPAHHKLCRAPVDGPFQSQSSALFALAEHTPGHIQECMARAGWKTPDVDYFVLHQPSNRILKGIAEGLEARPDQVPKIHGLYGNTESSAVPLTLRYLLDQGMIRPGSKLLLGSAAAGFIMSTLAVEWVA